jgi:hypothetical protein
MSIRLINKIAINLKFCDFVLSQINSAVADVISILRAGTLSRANKMQHTDIAIFGTTNGLVKGVGKV